MTNNLTNSQATGSEQGFVYFVAAIAALCGLLFGFDTGVISGAMLFLHRDFQLSPTSLEIVVSAVLFGALIGSFFSGRIADRFGRRPVIIITSIIFAAGSLVCAFTPNILWLIIGRIALGLAIGVASYTAPLYISEVAPSHVRGMLVSLNQLAITIGIVFSYIIDYSFAHTGNWRMMLGIGVLPAFILFIGMLFLPESPRWMVLRGKTEKAKSILTKIRNTSNVDNELADIKQTLAQERGTWSMLFSKRVLPVIVIGALLMFFQQVDGINTVIYYAPAIFKISGFHQDTVAILATLGVGIVNVLFTIIALPLLDRWGRRPLLFIGVFAMFVSLVAIGYAFATETHHDYLKWVTLGSLIVYIAGFAISLGPIAWLMAAEIFPLGVRGLGMSLVTACNWGLNMVVAMTFLTLLQVLGAGHTFWLFGLLSFVTIIFVFFFVPETKGITLEQIERNLQAGVKMRRLGDPEAYKNVK